MSAIKLLYAINTISRLYGRPRQDLSFAILVDNRAYDKRVEVTWRGEGGEWRQLPAGYAYKAGDHAEVWQARTEIFASEEAPLAGNVQFAVTGQLGSEVFWDNNAGGDYRLEADAGVLVPDPGTPLVTCDYQAELAAGQRQLAVTAVTNRLAGIKRVFVRWSTDHWQTFRETGCVSRRSYWDKTALSNARNPNQYGCQVWTAQLPVGGSYRVAYAVGCETDKGVVWDSNFGRNYGVTRGRLKVLTLNLHCYQESEQARKFSQIARAIGELDIDIICLQEVGENWNDGRGEWATNAARIINEQLFAPYHLHTDWSHIGFDRYREGVAILSKHPFTTTGARYVSASQDIYSIHARKVVMGQVDVPYFGKLNIFSAHLSWWRDGFPQQFDHLHRWARTLHGARVTATLLCGDFNVEAGSDGYALIVDAEEYEDQYLKTHNRHAFDLAFGKRRDRWREALAYDGRIDFIWLRKKGSLKAVAGREIFTDEAYGRVSDHLGYLVEFELN